MLDIAAPPRESKRLWLPLASAVAIHMGIFVAVSAEPSELPVKRSSIVDLEGFEVRPSSPEAPLTSSAPSESEREKVAPSSTVPSRGAPSRGRAVTSSVAPSGGRGIDSDEVGDLADWAMGEAGWGGTDPSGGVRRGVARSRDGLSGPSSLGAQSAQLVAEPSCSDLFPFGASVERVQVSLSLDLDETGELRSTHVVNVAPSEAGFAEAARLCAQRVQFQAARDATGKAVPSTTSLQLTFARKE